MKRLPSLKQLEYLVALADTLHFGHAADRCNITPSTLSAGIRDLENVLGIAVAERTKRQVLLTGTGADISARARLILRDAESLMELAAARQDPLSGALKLGVIPTISPFLLPRLLPSLTNKYPALRVYLREEQTAQLLERLRAGELDVALIALPYDISGLGLASKTILNDEFLFACHKNHPLSWKQKISLAALAGQPLMLLEEGHCLRGHALDACQLLDGRLRAQFEASSLHTLVQMVASGIGVTLLPKLATDADITRGTDIKLTPLSKKASRQIGLVWRQGSPRAAAFEMLGDTLLEFANV